MKRLFLLAFVGILLAGCNKEDEISDNFQFDGKSHEVTGAVIDYYYRPQGESVYDLYLLLDGFTWNDYLEDDSCARVRFELYFEGKLSELPEGSYRLGDGEILDYGDYGFYNATSEEYAELTSGTLTIRKNGENYSFSFDGMASIYDGISDEYLSPKPFKCSYSGPVEYHEEDF